MSLNTSAIEDGEIVDDDEAYTPLERPTKYTEPNSRFPPKEESESEGELQSASESDSDSDAEVYHVKRPKLKPQRRLKTTTTRRNNIWSTKMEEEVLAETLNSCEVTQTDRSRDVESYDYRSSYSYKNRTTNKRTRCDRKNKHLKPIKSKGEVDDVKGSQRHLLDLSNNPECSDADFAVEVANKLYEKKEDLIVKVVQVLGHEKIRKVYEEVKRIEANGGMLIMNQTRRRTPGGVFLFLIRHDHELTKEQHDEIFKEEKKIAKDVVKNKKKEQLKAMKAEIYNSKKSGNLPELLTKAEIVMKLSKETWSPKEGDQEVVTNPPPTPEAEPHVDSADNMDSNDVPPNFRKLDKYTEDFLDLHAEDNMDTY